MLIDRRSVIIGASIGAGGLLTGCATARTSTRPVPGVAFESLIRQIKHDVGSYIFQHQEDKLRAANSTTACAGQVDFIINKVKLTVTAQTEESEDVSAGLKVPIGLLTLEPSGSRSKLLSNTVTTALTVWPITAGAGAEFEDASLARQRLTAVPPPSPEFSGTPISDVLNRLREDLIATANTPPCFDFGQGPQENVVKWAFSVTTKEKFGGKFTLAVFSVGAESSKSHVFANTIEVSFIAVGDGFG